VKITSQQPFRGFTLVEAVVAAALLSVILGGLYMVLTRAFATQYLVQAKSRAKEQCEMVLRQVQRDLAASLATYTSNVYVPTFKETVAGANWTMKVATDGNPRGPLITINYSLNGKTLLREDGSNSKVLCNSVEAFSIVPTDNPITLKITAKTSAVAEGQHVLQYQEQSVLVTIQAMSQANIESHWKDPSLLKNNF
jgi:type II secretory pathway pseudopilin PulG